MFVNRGMFDAAQGEGEVVGVMAHELAHVLLRHGTANATKAQNFQIGAIAGAIAGAIIGGGVGRGDFAGLAVRPRRLADEVQPRIREAGRPARRADDGAGRLRPARSGEDVRDHRAAGEGQHPAAVAEQPPRIRATARSTSSRKPPSSPSPRGRTAAVSRPRRARFAGLPAAKSMADVTRAGGNGSEGGEAPASVGTVGQPVPAPSTQYRTPARRAAVPGQRARQLDRRVGQQRRQVRARRTGWASTGARTCSRTAWSWAWRGRRRAISARRPTPSSTRFCARTRGCSVAGSQRQVRISQRAGIGTVLIGRSALNRDRAGRRLHDVPGRRQPLLLPHGLAAVREGFCRT